jgi:competence protein ComEC
MICTFAYVVITRHKWWCWMLLVGVGFGGGVSALHAVDSAQLGIYQGRARIMEDPQWKNGGVQCVVEVQNQRFIVYAYGLEGRRLSGRQVGEVVVITGSRVPIDPSKKARYRSRHIVGMLTLSAVSERSGVAAPLYRSANGLRGLLQRSTKFMPRDEASLFTGLLIGDDRLQSNEMITAFRAAGLSHLTAVSGQNVAFLLAVAAPLLVRVRSRWRLIATMCLLLWFVVLTRAEPSVVRAAAMAGLGAYGVSQGLDVPPIRVLALAISALVVIDPLIAWSVGFWMSGCATAGLILLTPLIAKVMSGPLWFVGALSTTLGAQLGVMPITLWVFRSAPVVAVASNVLAVPVAGAVMLIGLPVGLFVGVLSQFSAMSAVCTVIMTPISLAVRWVWWIAVLGQKVSPSGLVNTVAWFVLGCSALIWFALRTRRTHLTE